MLQKPGSVSVFTWKRRRWRGFKLKQNAGTWLWRRVCNHKHYRLYPAHDIGRVTQFRLVKW